MAHQFTEAVSEAIQKAFSEAIPQKPPSCVRCEIGDRPGWEVYGENHEGRFRIIFNDRLSVYPYLIRHDRSGPWGCRRCSHCMALHGLIQLLPKENASCRPGGFVKLDFASLFSF